MIMEDILGLQMCEFSCLDMVLVMYAAAQFSARSMLYVSVNGLCIYEPDIPIAERPNPKKGHI